MSSSKPQKPSLIYLLAPAAIVLLGYHYLFNMSLQRDLKSNRDKASQVTSSKADRDLESSQLFEQIKDANQQIETAELDLKQANEELAALEEQRSNLVAAAIGQLAGNSRSGDVKSSPASVHAVVNSLVSTVGMEPKAIGGEFEPLQDTDAATAMMWVCEICDRRNLKRKANHLSEESVDRFDESERQELSKLLGQSIPKPTLFQLELEGSFLDLIGVLHEVSERLPMVSIHSLSMEQADSADQTRSWLLNLGITAK